MLYSKNEKTKVTAAITVWFFVIAVMAALVVAQVEPTENTALVAKNLEPASDDAAAPPQDDDEDEQMQIVDEDLGNGAIQSISFKKDMSIRDALRFLALKYQKNIVPSEKVEGSITVTNLYNVTFEEALQAILGTNKYEIQGNFIRVFTLEEFQQDKTRFDHAMITLYYINPDEAKKLVEPLLSESGRLGATTTAPPEMQAGKSGDTLAIHDRLVVSDYPERIKQIREVLSEVDVEPMQVLLEVTVMEATLTEETKFGVDWTNLNGVDISAGFSTGMNGVSTDFAPALTAVTSGGSGGVIAGITFDNISSIITAVETVTDVTIMANPKILALNKQAGKLIIGKEEGYQTLTNVAEGGTSTQQVEMLESGTILEFRPFIGKDGMIRMEINPEQSEGDIVSSLPVKTTTEVITNVMVKDGQTIVLGGLFKEETTLGRSQVPLLGDIPIVGELFRGVDDKSTRVELIILITPHIITTPEEADGADRLEDVKRMTSNARQNIYWMSRTKIAEDRYKAAVSYYLDGDFEAALAQLSGYLEMDRNFHEAVRLKEKIISEMNSADSDNLERIMIEKIEKEKAEKWFRR